MNNEFISNLLFSNVEDNEEKENYIKAIAYVNKQSAKGEEIDNDKIDKILGISSRYSAANRDRGPQPSACHLIVKARDSEIILRLQSSSCKKSTCSFRLESASSLKISRKSS